MELIEDIINSLHEDAFSELGPDDILDDDIPDINEDELEVEKMPEVEQYQEIDTKVQLQQKLVEQYEEENL